MKPQIINFDLRKVGLAAEDGQRGTVAFLQ
jgi:hypothetical protein